MSVLTFYHSTGRFTYSCMQNYDGDVQELCLDFTVTEESFGKRHVVELKSGGKDISVINENKMQYIHAMADYKLNQQVLSPVTVVYFCTVFIVVSWVYKRNNFEIADIALFQCIL